MTFVLSFIIFLTFWMFVWFGLAWVFRKYKDWRKKRYAEKHFKQTERFRNDEFR